LDGPPTVFHRPGPSSPPDREAWTQAPAPSPSLSLASFLVMSVCETGRSSSPVDHAHLAAQFRLDKRLSRVVCRLLAGCRRAVVRRLVGIVHGIVVHRIEGVNATKWRKDRAAPRPHSREREAAQSVEKHQAMT